jgi:hypothetical protein
MEKNWTDCEGKFTFRETVKGQYQKVTITCAFHFARWMVVCGYVTGGVFDMPTNRIYL